MNEVTLKQIMDTGLTAKDFVRITQTQSTVKFNEIDKTSSSVYVYMYDDIEETTVTDEETGEETIMYTATQYVMLNELFFKQSLLVATENSALLEQELVRLNEVLTAENNALKEELLFTQLAVIEMFESTL